MVRASSAAGAPQEGGEPKRGFVQQLTKSLRDFGFGKTSLVQGGVGLFVFSGIGEHAIRQSHDERTGAAHHFHEGFQHYAGSLQLDQVSAAML